MPKSNIYFFFNISQKIVHTFLSNVADGRTDRLTDRQTKTCQFTQLTKTTDKSKRTIVTTGPPNGPVVCRRRCL